MSKYIVQISNDSKIFNDGVLWVDGNTLITEIKENKNVIKLHGSNITINDNIVKISNDIDTFIKFGNQSVASLDNFVKLLLKLSKRIRIKELYENGNISYEGDVIGDNKDGKGKLYYRNGNPKYIGEFDNDNFDGSGIFYSKCGKFKLECKNIVENEICDGANLYKLGIKIKKIKGTDINLFSDNFIYKLCEENGINVNKERFLSMDNDEKFLLLNSRIEKLENRKPPNYYYYNMTIICLLFAILLK